MKKFLIVSSIVLIATVGLLLSRNQLPAELNLQTDNNSNMDSGGDVLGSELSVEMMRERDYPGSEIKTEEELSSGSNYKRYVTSYLSEGNKIYALLTIPSGTKPEGGWPVIVFNHGFIPPAEYRTTERYVAYVDYFARSGYIVFKSDYRGHGSSEGSASGGYGTPAYTVDVLNAVSSIKTHEDANPDKIGMWGHSMGGHITLRSMVTTKDVKVGVIWAGVVASYEDLLNNWRRGPTNTQAPIPSGARRWRQALVEEHGDPASNPTFWNSISPTSYLKDLSGPIQLHSGTADHSVPYEFSVKLDKLITEAGGNSEVYLYEGDDHNISANFSTAMKRSLESFDRVLK